MWLTKTREKKTLLELEGKYLALADRVDALTAQIELTNKLLQLQTKMLENLDSRIMALHSLDEIKTKQIGILAHEVFPKTDEN